MKQLLLSAMLVVATLFGGIAVGPVGVAGAQETCSFPVTETDATGTEVTIEEEPERIVTLSPSAAQTMWEIGGQEKVVGVTKFSTYLDGANAKANVSGAGMTTVVPEKVVAQNPDLVLAPNVIPDQTVQTLRDAGLTVYKFEESESIEDIYAKTELTGQLTGECDGAAETVSWMKDRVNTVEQAVSGEDSPKVLYVMSGGFTAGEGTFINKIIETAGGTNIAAEADISGYKQISNEVVVQQQPDWFIVSAGMEVPNAYSETPAAQQNQTISLDSNYASQPAPRIVHPITKLAKTFHPEAYEQANLTTTTTEMGDDTRETTTTTDSQDGATGETTTESGGQPGFGGVGAVVAGALAVVTLLARRE
ncbi:iron complex transport system substrate-binding protein [Haladaptatus litoreus]|uniref:Iron complex transport system substrate-binding protein n=1 Tax=Haladaptatus litoreus TaxID=553468 RepID=A0A1N6X3J3_9EURY|nr:PGF-CTERM-anchored ABC transporter substrate-binding protein [Haladaptatus litoreus]SIQ96928.1 iron complex transport system substrate-binding protein [Haladaptatus litoreus]